MSGNLVPLCLTAVLLCTMLACGGGGAENGQVSASEYGQTYGPMEIPPYACWGDYSSAVCDYIRQPDEMDIAFTFQTDYRSVAPGTVLVDQVDFSVDTLAFKLLSGPPNTGIDYFDDVDVGTGALTVTIGAGGTSTSATIAGSVTQQYMTLLFKNVSVQLP